MNEAVDGEGVRRVFARDPPNLVTLDLDLGSEDGLDIVREIRLNHDTAIMIVTGRGNVMDRVVGLELGADDYMTKPFHGREVVARVRTILRRTGGRAIVLHTNNAGGGTLLYLDGLLIDLDSLSLTNRYGKDSDLTSGDFRLLSVFLHNAKRSLSRDRLMDLTGGTDWTPLDRTIDNQVARLRKKIERDPARPILIKTVRGIGYMLTENPSSGLCAPATTV